MIKIDFLADHLDTIPTLARWFREQWSDYYANKSDAQMEQGFLSEAFRDRLPSRLVAFASGELAGTIVLREPGSVKLPRLQPELGGLYVLKQYRDQDVGTELVRSGMQLALDQGYETVYATTTLAANILTRLGWEYIDTIAHHDEQLELYRCKL